MYLHYQTKGHALSDLRIQEIEKVMPNTKGKRKLLDQKTVHKSPLGLNTND